MAGESFGKVRKKISINTRFYSRRLSFLDKRRMLGRSYHENDTISWDDLRYLHVTYIGFDEKEHRGELVVNQSIAKSVLQIFYHLYEIRYHIGRMRLIDDYDGDDELSMSANNSSAFNYRRIEGTNEMSNHAFGLAIDINPLINPYVRGEYFTPNEGAEYLNRNVDTCTGEYRKWMIQPDSEIVNIFKHYGFRWGGEFTHCIDNHHFEYAGN